MSDLKPHFVVYHGGWHDDNGCFIYYQDARDTEHILLLAILDEFECTIPPEENYFLQDSNERLKELIDRYIKPDCDLRELTIVMIGEGVLPRYETEFDTDSILGLDMPRVNAPYTAPLDFVDWNHNERH